MIFISAATFRWLGPNLAVKNMKVWIYPALSQRFNGVGGVMVWGIYFWHTLGSLIPIKFNRLNATVYLSIVADHVHPFMTHLLMSQSSNHLRLVSWTWQCVHLLKWPPQSSDLNPIEHLWDVVEQEIHIMDVQPTNLQQLRDAIMSIVESMPRRIKAVLKAKWGPTRY